MKSLVRKLSLTSFQSIEQEKKTNMLKLKCKSTYTKIRKHHKVY